MLADWGDDIEDADEVEDGELYLGRSGYRDVLCWDSDSDGYDVDIGGNPVEDGLLDWGGDVEVLELYMYKADGRD